MTQREAIRDIHDRVRQCFTRHRFTTYGDALGWWHEADHEIQKLEAGEQGMSKFATDILWLVSAFGPKEPVDYKAMTARKVPALKPVAVEDEPEIDPQDAPPKISRPRKKKARRRRRF